MSRRPARFAIAFVAVVALGLLFAFRAPLVRACAAAAIDGATGYQVAFDDLLVSNGRISVRGLHVQRSGEPVLDADAADARVSARQLVFGGAHRYGLESIALERPHLYLIRHQDGGFNLPAGSATSGPPAGTGESAGGTPLAFALTLHDGSLTIVDPNRVLRIARRIDFGAIEGSALVDSAARTSYRLRATLANRPSQPLEVRGRIDASGFAIHRMRGAVVSIVPVADYFINTPSAEMADGIVRNLDLRLFTFGARPDGSPDYHVVGTGQLEDGTMHLPDILVPATRMRGRVDLYDDGLVAPKLRARLGALDLLIGGGLYDRLGPQFRLGMVAARAPLRDVRRLFQVSRNLPLDGTARVSTFVESAVGSPLVVIRADAPHLAYDGFPVSAVSGRAVYYRSALAIAGVRGSYGGIATSVEGAVAFGDVVHTQLVVDAGVPAARIPYAAQIAPEARLHATALLAGDALKIDARGVVDGAGAGTTLSGVFHVDPEGDGAFGPLRVSRAGGAGGAGAFYLNRSRSESGFWLDARDYPFEQIPSDPHLPGLALAPPLFGGRLSGAVAGLGPPSNFRVAGSVRARALEVGGLHIDAVDGNLAGQLANLRLGAVAARGPWGEFRGSGAYQQSALVLAGNYRGSFAALRTVTGDLGGSGPIDGPLAVLVSPHRTLVQARDDRSLGATVHGVPVDHLSGTFDVALARLRVYAATAKVAGGTFAAAGYVDGARGVGVSVAGAKGLQLGAIAPLGAGSVAAIGKLRRIANVAHFDGGLALGEATLDRLPLAGNGDLSLWGTQLDVRTTDARLGDALGSFDGSVANLGTRAPRYDLNLHLRATRIGPLAAILVPQERGVAGTLNGDVRVFGSETNLSVNGRVAVPEGTVNGLAFRDATAGLEVTPAGLFIQRGGVTVGTTEALFGAAFYGSGASMRVKAAHADLSDFNDYFDAGDTLGGKGRVAVSFRKHGPSVLTDGDIAIAGLSYRRFDLGNATAAWSSSGANAKARLAFGGASGRLRVAGRYVLAAHAPLEKLLERSRFIGAAQLRGLDLGVWLPALGFALPIDGRVDADATIAGSLRDPTVDTDFSMVHGSLGRFPVDRLEVSAVSTPRRTTITHATLNLPSIELTAAGNLGFGARDPLSLAVHVKSPNVGAFAEQLLGSNPALSGAAEADVKVGGTRDAPRVTGGFDLEQATFHGVAIPQALGEFSVAGRDIVVSDAEIGLAKGTVYLAGSLPLVVDPFGFGPANAPIDADFKASGVDFADFAPLLPQGSTLSGTLDGHVAINGTAGNPQVNGALTVGAGTFRAPFEVVPIGDIAAQVTFAGNAARLVRFHAAAGGGTLDASGNARFSNLVHPSSDAAYQFDARAAHLELDVPAYGSGQVDGTLSLTHEPHDRPLLSGNLALSDATIPFSALLFADSGAGGFETSAAVAPPAPIDPSEDVALDLELGAQRNVRVRSANVDIGARGAIHVGGTRSAPSLLGGFTSAGGTLSYFNTVFRLIDGKVDFEPDLGVIPTLDARAVTHVLNPDPNTVRNITGGADVTLAVHGPVTNLSISLTSDPPYDREQILGLLLSAPALGASNLFGQTGQATLYGSTTPNVPPGTQVPRVTSGEITVAQEAFGVANAQFTRALLAPIESTVAEAVGLTNINVNVDYLGNVGLTARKILGKNINAIYGTTFGYPYRQTFGFELKPNDTTAAQVTVFETLGAYGLTSLTPEYLNSSSLKIQEAEPYGGTVGFSLSLQRLFP